MRCVPILNITKLLVVAFLWVNTGACQKLKQTFESFDLVDSNQCQFLKFPRKFLGANLIDRPDDLDDDPENDGLRGYGSYKSEEILQRLKDDRMQSVLLPVELWIENISSTQVHLGDLLQEPQLSRLRKMIGQAHTKRMPVVLVPHLHSRDHKWRGELSAQFLGESEHVATQKFFKSYTQKMLILAKIAQEECVELLSIGIEFKSLTAKSANHPHFLKLIQAIREVYSGKLTYSANWDEVENVPFWQQLDLIAVNAFFPLEEVTDQNNKEIIFSDQHFRVWIESVKRIHRELEILQKRDHLKEKPIFFLELGFQSITDTAAEPWLWPEQTKSRKYSENTQYFAYLAHLDTFIRSDVVDGIFFWAVASDLSDYRSSYRFESQKGFSFIGKKIEDYLAEVGSMTYR